MKKLILFLIFASGFMIAAPTPDLESLIELEELKTGQKIKENPDFLELQTSTIKTEEDECIETEQCIYGYELFNKSPTTFALSSDISVPADYILGPGDEIKLNYYGSTSLSQNSYIDRSGYINLPMLRPINIGGLTLKSAKELIQKTISEELIGTKVMVLMGELRAINVYLLGEAFKPGTYTVGSLSSVTNILFSSGGVSKIGSLRNIQIKRQGKVVAIYDFYDFLLSGDTSGDTRLQDGDTIFIPLIENRASVVGAVLRSSFFEIKNETNINDLLLLAGVKSQYNQSVEISSYDPSIKKRTSVIHMLKDAKSISVSDGDVINVLDNKAAAINSIELLGEFNFPGVYSINKDDKLLDIINRAGGLTSDAYAEGAIFTRKSVAEIEKISYRKTADNLERALINTVTEGDSLEGNAYAAVVGLIEKLRIIKPVGRQVIEVDPFILKSDPRLNISLQNGDTLIIPKRTDSISVVGEVLNPVTHIYDSELDVNDYISLSGGLSDGADKDRIFIISPNGQSTLFANKLFLARAKSSLLPGSTIVVSRDTKPFDWIQLTGIVTPILSDLAVSAAAIAAISDNN